MEGCECCSSIEATWTVTKRVPKGRGLAGPRTERSTDFYGRLQLGCPGARCISTPSPPFSTVSQPPLPPSLCLSPSHQVAGRRHGDAHRLKPQRPSRDPRGTQSRGQCPPQHTPGPTSIAPGAHPASRVWGRGSHVSSSTHILLIHHLKTFSSRLKQFDQSNAISRISSTIATPRSVVGIGNKGMSLARSMAHTLMLLSCQA